MAIKRVIRVLEKAGSEYLRIVQVGQIIGMPWNKEILASLKPHFTDETRFYVNNEVTGRTYSGPRKKWERLTAVDFIECGKTGDWSKT